MFQSERRNNWQSNSLLRSRLEVRVLLDSLFFMKSVTLIGHITDDLLPNNHLGGSVSYAACVFKKHGYDTTIITKAPPNHGYLQQLMKLKIKVINLENNVDSVITTFSNKFINQDFRTQIVKYKAQSVTYLELEPYKELILNRPVVLCPIINEIDFTGSWQAGKNNHFFLIGQGLLRKTDNDNNVVFNDEYDKSMFSKAKTTILSYEDFMIKGQVQKSEIQKIVNKSNLLIMTNADMQTDIYIKGKFFKGIETYNI